MRLPKRSPARARHIANATPRRLVAAAGSRSRRLARAIAGFDIRRRDHAAALVLACALVLASVIGLVSLLGGEGARHLAAPPVPPPPASNPAVAKPSPSTAAAPRPERKLAPYTCPAAHAAGGGDAPQEICIPALRVATSVIKLGLNADHTVQVPTLSQVRLAGWYRYSAPPGSVGPTVILGHVDSAEYGEGVFFHLSALRAGDQVRVQRGDGKVAVYRINQVVQVSKKHFPTDAVYGATSGPAIRLVTCGGTFDASTGNYLDNIIAYGTLLQLTDA